jgi:hypothetical protein
MNGARNERNIWKNNPVYPLWECTKNERIILKMCVIKLEGEKTN